jgi:hypothetical protein
MLLVMQSLEWRAVKVNLTYVSGRRAIEQFIDDVLTRHMSFDSIKIG